MIKEHCDLINPRGESETIVLESCFTQYRIQSNISIKGIVKSLIEKMTLKNKERNKRKEKKRKGVALQYIICDMQGNNISGSTQ